jgi:hypothetical protein
MQWLDCQRDGDGDDTGGTWDWDGRGLERR